MTLTATPTPTPSAPPSGTSNTASATSSGTGSATGSSPASSHTSPSSAGNSSATSSGSTTGSSSAPCVFPPSSFPPSQSHTYPQVSYPDWCRFIDRRERCRWRCGVRPRRSQLLGIAQLFVLWSSHDLERFRASSYIPHDFLISIRTHSLQSLPPIYRSPLKFHPNHPPAYTTTTPPACRFSLLRTTWRVH